MQVTATKQFPYPPGQRRRIGDTFEMGDEDARKMIGFGKVTPAAAEEQKTRRAYRRRDMIAEGTQDS